MPIMVSPPPPTPIEPVTEILHGVPITDRYRWLEAQNSTRTRKWLKEQAAYTNAYLDAIPGRERIRKRVEELLTVEVVSEPWKVGNRYFYLKRPTYQQQPAIMMRELDSGEVVLLDPASRGSGDTAAVKIINISQRGNILAYGVRCSGEDFQSVEFFDLDREKVLPDRLPVGFGPSLVFSANGLGFYYSHEVINGCNRNRRAVYWHAFGNTQNSDFEIFCAGEDPDVHVGVIGSTDGQLLLFPVTHSRDARTVDLYLFDLSGDKRAHKILQSKEAVFCPFVASKKLLALTDWKAPNLRIVAIDPQCPGREHWVDVVPHSLCRIKDFAVVADSICVGYVEQLASKIEVFELDGQWRNTIPCPRRGTASLLQRPVESDVLFYNFSSFDRPPTIFSYQVRTGEHTEWTRNRVAFNPSSFEIEQAQYKSRDGTVIPLSLVARKRQRLNKLLPTFLTGYGGFGKILTPQFNAYSTFLIERGFLFAVASLRGGGEFGEEWHHQGKRLNRQNVIDDFICAAEWLLESGRTARGKLAIGGGSNAGLVVGAALTQRPDLFRAAVCVGPLLDMLRYHLFDFANMWIDEYGSPEIEVDFRHILAYSPYQRVQERMPYPAVMLVSGDADTRCNPMHARKMTARLQAASSSGRPIILDYKPTWGHLPLQPLTQRIEALTDRLAFICQELDVTV